MDQILTLKGAMILLRGFPCSQAQCWASWPKDPPFLITRLLLAQRKRPDGLPLGWTDELESASLLPKQRWISSGPLEWRCWRGP